MAELMHHNYDSEGQLGNSHILEAEQRVSVGDASNVLHGTIFIIWTHYVIYLAERKSGSKILLIKV
jgi:hypothetical protein